MKSMKALFFQILGYGKLLYKITMNIGLTSYMAKYEVRTKHAFSQTCKITTRTYPHNLYAF